MPHILLVDDDAGIRESMADILKYEGYEVVAVARGNDALPLLRSRKWHAVLIDLLLPDLPGELVLAAARNTFRIAMSASPRYLEQAPGEAKLAKPFELETLLYLLKGPMRDQAATPAPWTPNSSKRAQST